MKKPREKKSESLEIRLPYSQKTAFIEACREQGISASEALRLQIDSFVEEMSAPQKPQIFGATFDMIKRHKAKTLMGFTCLATSLSLGLALPSQADDALFRSFDRNGDGVLTEGEISPNDSPVFMILDKDKSGEITADEFKRNAEITEIIDRLEPGKTSQDEAKRVVGIERTSFALNPEGEVDVYRQQWTEDVDPNASEADIRNVVEGLKLQLNDVQKYEAMEGLDGQAKLQALREVKKAEKLHTRVELEELEKLRIELSELESLDLNLSDLEHLEELKGLEELEKLSALGDIDLEIELDFSDLPDFSDIDAELAAILEENGTHLSEEERREIEAAREELRAAKSELAELRDVERVFIIRKEKTVIDGDGEPQVKVRVERLHKDDTK